MSENSPEVVGIKRWGGPRLGNPLEGVLKLSEARESEKRAIKIFEDRKSSEGGEGFAAPTEHQKRWQMRFFSLFSPYLLFFLII